MYPLKFSPVYKKIIWGGTKIKSYFNRDMTDDNIAESWEICSRSDGMSIISNGELEGRALQSVIDEYGEKLLGKQVVKQFGSDFPLLIKLIDANDDLSVQVHPDDAYARLCGEKNGKNELWYIVDAKENANLVYGLKKEVTKEKFAESVEKGIVAETLNKISVKSGDALFIPAGTVHAILSGLLIAEIQQNSNTTYRIYDWNRLDSSGTGRELHVDKALDVISFKQLPNEPSVLLNDENKDYKLKAILRSEFFNVDEANINVKYNLRADGNGFFILMNLQGCGNINYSEGNLEITAGETVLIPADLGKFSITGELKLLVIYM